MKYTNKKGRIVIGSLKNRKEFKQGLNADLHHHIKLGAWYFGEQWDLELFDNYSLQNHDEHINKIHGACGRERYPHLFWLKSGKLPQRVILEWLLSQEQKPIDKYFFETRLRPVLIKAKNYFANS